MESDDAQEMMTITNAPDEAITGHMDVETMVRMSKVDWNAAIERRLAYMQEQFQAELNLANAHLAQQVQKN